MLTNQIPWGMNVTWSHKPGSTDVNNTDDAGEIIIDPRKAESTYTFIKFYEVGPNEDN